MKNHFHLLFNLFVLISISFSSCVIRRVETEIQPGDILFQDLDCGPLCDAIESVTFGIDNRHFSHCGIVIMENDSFKVVEAIGEKVIKSSISNFFKRSRDTAQIKNIIIGRLKKPYQKLISPAISFSVNAVGEPYDDEFLPDNGKWYCSELIHEAFRYANEGKPLFVLEPMTFKNPKTRKFYPAWEEYYQKLGKPIPEGVPGINPGLLSRSSALEIIYSSGIRQY